MTVLRHMGLLWGLLWLGFPSWATHITGADLTYTCINAATHRYQIDITLYRDCLNGQAPFDDPIILFVFRSQDDSLYTTQDIPFPNNASPLLAPNWDACLASFPSQCLEYATYSTQLILPPILEGYDIGWARCCRNNAITNIQPGVGVTLTAHIPGSDVGSCNSMPLFNELPPTFLCMGEAFSFDHSATDPDGDSLVYRVVPPYTGLNINSEGASLFNPVVTNSGLVPNPMGPPPYQAVTFLPGYSFDDPFGSGNFYLDPMSGQLTLVPTQIGLSVFAIAVDEYRNGVLLSRHIRDFQINVVACQSQGPSPHITHGVDSLIQGVGDTLFVSAQDTICYAIQATDSITADTVELFPVSAAFGVGGNPISSAATLIYSGTNPVIGEVCWAVPCAFAGDTLPLIVGARDPGDCIGYRVSYDTVWVVVEELTQPTTQHSVSGLPLDTVDATVNSAICYQIQAQSSRASDSLTFLSFGNLSINTFGGNPAQAQVCWTPSCTQADTYVPLVVQARIANHCGQTVSDTMIARVGELPTISIEGDSGLCPGDSAQLWATGGTLPSWSPVGALSHPDSISTWASPYDTTQYTLTLTDSLGCVQTSTFTLPVFPLPPVNAGEDTVQCAQFPLGLNASGGVSYVWEQANGVPIANTASVSVITDSTTYFFVTATDIRGCRARDSVRVRKWTANAGPDIYACPGDTTLLQASGAIGYDWDSLGNLLSPQSATPFVWSEVDTSFVLVATDTSGCMDRDTAYLRMWPLPTPNMQMSSPLICAGDTLTLWAEGGLTYEWGPQPQMLLSADSTTLAIFPPAPDGQDSTWALWVAVQDSNGCQVRDSVFPIIRTEPTVSFTGDTIICPGDTTELWASGGISYQWIGVLQDSGTATPVVSFDTTSLISVTITDQWGCIANRSLEVRIPQTDAGTDRTICWGDTATLSAAVAVSYTWSPSGSLLQANSATPLAFPQVDTWYSLTVVDSLGCNLQDSVLVTVFPLPPIFAGNDTTICWGDAAWLMGSGGLTYEWQDSSGAFLTDTPFLTSEPVNNQNYILIGQDSAGCQARDTATVNVQPLPIVTASTDTALQCGDTPVSLSAMGGVSYTWQTTDDSVAGAGVSLAYQAARSQWLWVEGADSLGCRNRDSIWLRAVRMRFPINPLYKCAKDSIPLTVVLQDTLRPIFSWTPAFSLSQTTDAVAISSSPVDTSYVLTVTDRTGCVLSDTIEVQMWPPPPLDVTPDTTICRKDTLQLQATGGVSYQWFRGREWLGNENELHVSPGTAETYHVIATGPRGCRDTANVEVSLWELPTVAAAPDTIVCAQQPIALTASGGALYDWSPANALDDPTIATPTAWLDTSTTIQVIGVDAQGCRDTGSVFIHVLPRPSIASPQDTQLCVGQAAFLDVGGAPTYQWSTGSRDAQIRVVPGTTTTYWVIGQGANGCFSDTGFATITVATHLPDPAFWVDADEGPAPFTVNFQNRSQHATQYFWDFGDGSSSHEPFPHHTYTIPGNYTVILTADNDIGCPVSRSYQFVEVWGARWYIPNAFTPNGDGRNDTFKGSITGAESLSLTIFNRWGKPVFNSTQADFQWDGRLPEGIPAPGGTYTFILQGRTLQGELINQQGTLTLIR